MEDEVECFAKIALDDSKTWLWETGLAFFQGRVKLRGWSVGTCLRGIKVIGTQRSPHGGIASPNAFKWTCLLMDPQERTQVSLPLVAGLLRSWILIEEVNRGMEKFRDPARSPRFGRCLRPCVC